MAVTGDTHLSGKNDVVADMRRAGKTDLGTEQGIFAHRGAVADLHQVIDLAAAPDPRLADARPVDAGVGLYLHIVGDDRRARTAEFFSSAPSSPLAKPKPSPPITAPFCKTTRSPIRQASRTTAWAWAKKSSPICAPG